MDQLSEDVEAADSGEKPGAVPWIGMSFTVIYGAAMVAMFTLLTFGPFAYVWQTCIAVTGAANTIGWYLLVMAPRRFFWIVALLFLSHAIVYAIAYDNLAWQDPAMLQHLFWELGAFLISLAGVSATLAVWHRRRYWRIAPCGDEEPELPKRVAVAMNRLDYFFLAAVIGALFALHKVIGVVTLSVICVAALQMFVQVALAPAKRGFSPVAVILTGYGCLAAFCLAGWTFYPTYSIVLMIVVGLPTTLWCGILLSLRADGYRRVRDFAAYAENLPIAEPDPLA